MKCLVSHNSTAYNIWEFVVCLNMIYIIIFMPLVVATNDIYSYIILRHSHFSTIDLCSCINLFDMAFQLIVQHKTGEDSYIIYIRDSAKHYIKGKFIVDLISNVLFFILIISPQEILNIIIHRYLLMLEENVLS